MSLALASQGLTKRFRGGQLAVADLDLAVPAGSVYGFLGPNGSGKTTTIRMLLGLIVPTRGSWEVLGAPMPAGASRVLRRVGALIEGPAFHPYLTGWDNLARLDAGDRLADPRTSRARIGRALERVGLSASAGKRYRNYSMGMRQRLGLAAALLRSPRLLVLDEPTNGLDPHGMREIRDLLVELVAGGTTVFLSSHLLAEVEQICSSAAIVHQGALVIQDRVSALLAPTGRVQVATPDLGRAAELAARMAGTELGERRDDRLVVQLDGSSPEALNRHLVEGGVRVRELVVERPSLEDVFLRLTAGVARRAGGPGDRAPQEDGDAPG
jgi:ABC-2 type transport system ATP-binding protein